MVWAFHRACGVRGFRVLEKSSCENVKPSLRSYEPAGGYNVALGTHSSIGINRIWKEFEIEQSRGGQAAMNCEPQREEREAELLTRGEPWPSGSWSKSTRAWPPAREITGEGFGSPERVESQRVEREKVSLWLGLGLEAFFKTHYGRTGQSTVPVWCTPDNTQ